MSAYAHGALGPRPQDLDELDVRVARGAEVTRQAMDLAIGLDHGTATVAQAREFLEQDHSDGDPYVDTSSLVAELMRGRHPYCGRLQTAEPPG